MPALGQVPTDQLFDGLTGDIDRNLIFLGNLAQTRQRIVFAEFLVGDPLPECQEYLFYRIIH